MFKNVHFKNFYLFIFILWYSTEVILNTTLKTALGIPVDTINSIINWLVFFMLIIQIVLFQSYKKSELIIILVITVPVIVSTVLSGNRILLSAWMFIVAAKNNSLEKIILIAYRILLIMIPIVICLCIFGVIEDYTIMRGSVQRFSLGFSHPNQLGLRVFQLTLCHCYVNKNKLGALNYCYIILATIFAFIIPNSQTTYISLIVFLLLLLIYKYIENQRQLILKIYARILLIGALLLNILSIILSYIDVNKNIILSQIDKWMSARFSLCHRVWLIYGWSFWGSRIYVTEEERKLVGITRHLWLDNAYVSILLRYGVVIFLVFSVFYLCLIKNMAVRKEYVLVTILFLYSLYGIMENGLYMVRHNIFLIAFSDLLYNKRNGERYFTNGNLL